MLMFDFIFFIVWGRLILSHSDLVFKVLPGWILIGISFILAILALLSTGYVWMRVGVELINE